MHRVKKIYIVMFIFTFSCDGESKVSDKVQAENCEDCDDVQIRCDSKAVEISPLIYGLAFNARKNYRDKEWIHELNPSTRRWGGNPSSRYNWRINSWNTAQDWFFKNTRPGENFVFNTDFLQDNNIKNISPYITLPLLGWVAKDSFSGSYPLKLYAEQDKIDDLMGLGNGRWKDKKIVARPEHTSEKLDENELRLWVKDVDSRSTSVPIFALGNEPMLWNHTHYDVHYEPTGYDEIFQKSVSASKIVKENSEALVAGPASWGWSSYFYSSLDMETGVHNGADRRKYKKPFLEWFLGKFKEYEIRTGVRLLDALDVHYYPQAPGVFQGGDEPDLRWRSTKSLWDESYVDESWIKEPVFLLPRMKRIIGENYPETKLIIGEYSFGETNDVSSALAMAESLGTFAQHGVYAAYYWVYPERYTPTYWGFRMFRNYDGIMGSFADNLIGVFREDMYSRYVSISKDRARVTAVLINADKKERKTRLIFRQCPDLVSLNYFEYNGADEIKGQKIKDFVVISERSLGLIEVKFKMR